MGFETTETPERLTGFQDRERRGRDLLKHRADGLRCRAMVTRPCFSELTWARDLRPFERPTLTDVMGYEAAGGTLVHSGDPCA